MIKIDELISSAMRSQDKVSLAALRLLKSRIMEFKTQKNAPQYTDEVEIGIMRKMVKGLRETGDLYAKNGRNDLAEHEFAQAVVIEGLLPAVPSEADVVKYLSEHYPSGIDKKQIGIVIKEVKSCLVGVDGAIVASVVRGLLKE